MILLTIILMDILTGMEFDLFVPSFPELQAHFGLTPFWVEALLSVNFIGYCLGLFGVGSLADHYGRKPMILTGVGLFILGSMLCLWGQIYPLLLLGRFLQGVGIAAPAILSFLIIADRFPLQEQQFFLTMLNGSMNIAVAIAPVIGSYLSLYFGWHGNFVALLILGILVLLMTLGFIPAGNRISTKAHAFFEGYAAIFESKLLLLMIITILLIYVPYWIFVGMSPLLYMKNLGVGLAHFGFYQGVLAFVFAIGSIGFGLILKKQSQKTWLNLCNAIFVLSLFAIGGVILLEGKHPLLITLAMLVLIVGQIPSSLLYPLCLSLMPEAKGKISALIQGGRLILASLSLQVAGYFYTGSFMSVGVLLLIVIALSVVALYKVIGNPILMNWEEDRPKSD